MIGKDKATREKQHYYKLIAGVHQHWAEEDRKLTNFYMFGAVVGLILTIIAFFIGDTELAQASVFCTSFFIMPFIYFFFVWLFSDD